VPDSRRQKSETLDADICTSRARLVAQAGLTLCAEVRPVTPEPGTPTEHASTALSALVVEPVLSHLTLLRSALSSLGFDVIVAESFQDARASMAGEQPLALLVTNVRLREYNGLHLVLRARTTRPGLAAIVTSEAEDPVLQAETERLGATFVVLPASRAEIAAAVLRTVLSPTSWTDARSPVRAPFERRRRQRRAAPVPAEVMQERRVADRRRDAASALRDAASTSQS
jgi:DNA-binding NtrC family response regulator